VFEFLLPSRFLHYLADNLYLGVVVLIFFLFSQVIFPVNTHRIFNKTTYVIVVIVILSINFLYALIDFKNAFHCDDEESDSGTEIHSLIMYILELLISIGNLVLAYFVGKKRLKQDATESESEEYLRELLNQSEDIREAKRKLWTVSIG